MSQWREALLTLLGERVRGEGAITEGHKGIFPRFNSHQKHGKGKSERQ